MESKSPSNQFRVKAKITTQKEMQLNCNFIGFGEGFLKTLPLEWESKEEETIGDCDFIQCEVTVDEESVANFFTDQRIYFFD